MSASTIIVTSALKSTSGVHPSFWRAFVDIANEVIDLRGPKQLGILLDARFPVEPRVLARDLHQLADGMAHAGGDDVVVRLVLLEHQPHRAHVVAGESPVAPRVEVAEAERCRPGQA